MKVLTKNKTIFKLKMQQKLESFILFRPHPVKMLAVCVANIIDLTVPLFAYRHLHCYQLHFHK